MGFLSPPEGFNSWDEYDRFRKETGPSLRKTYPNEMTEAVATHPVFGLLVPGAEQFLRSGQNPTTSDAVLAGVDAASGILPLGAIAGAVSKTPAAKAAKESITNIGQWLIKVRTKGLDYLPQKKVREEAKKLNLPGSPRGQSVSSASITAADKAIASGKTDDFVVLPQGSHGAEHLPLSTSHFTPLAHRRNTPKQREYLKTLKTRSNPKGYDVDSLSDDQVAQLVRRRHGWETNPSGANRYMATIDEDIGSTLGGKGLNISTNPDLQRAVAEMDVSTIERYVSQTAHAYLKRQGLNSRDIPVGQWNQLKDTIRSNLLLRRERLQPENAPALWALGKEPQLVIQTHHGKPTAEHIGGSVIDPRNIWGVSGSAVQGGTHGLVHTPTSEVNPFYQSLTDPYYNPYYEEAIKSQKRGAEPYSGFLNEVQGRDPNLWDYNMRMAFEKYGRKKM